MYLAELSGTFCLVFIVAPIVGGIIGWAAYKVTYND